MSFAEMIAEAVRASDPNADDAHVARVVAGVSADPAWKDLTWLTPSLASGVLQTQLNARAVAISKALKIAETAEQAPVSAAAKPVHERYDMTAQEFRALPPHKKRELAEAAASHDAKEARASDNITALKAKAEAGTITPTERLTLAHLTPGPTKAQRRDPMWRRAQEETASVAELQKLIRGHEQIYASGAYPEVLRADHRAQADRLRNIIKQREEA